MPRRIFTQSSSLSAMISSSGWGKVAGIDDYAAYRTGPRGPNKTADFNECCVTHGPGLARIAAELVTTGRTDVDISAYRVDRFADPGDEEIQAAAEGQYLMRHPPQAGVAATPFGIELP